MWIMCESLWGVAVPTTKVRLSFLIVTDHVWHNISSSFLTFSLSSLCSFTLTFAISDLSFSLNLCRRTRVFILPHATLSSRKLRPWTEYDISIILTIFVFGKSWTIHHSAWNVIPTFSGANEIPPLGFVNLTSYQNIAWSMTYLALLGAYFWIRWMLTFLCRNSFYPRWFCICFKNLRLIHVDLLLMRFFLGHVGRRTVDQSSQRPVSSPCGIGSNESERFASYKILCGEFWESVAL